LDDLFDRFDTNHDGYLDIEEIDALMREAHRRKNTAAAGSVRAEALDFLREADRKRDGRLDRDEFYHFYKSH
jgi:Ca2+-binding EF-hand superfamily protein